MSTQTLEFWFEFASSYSYLSVMRIEPLARKYLQHRPVMGSHHHGAGAVDAKTVAGVQDEIAGVAVAGQPHAARGARHQGADTLRQHRGGVAFEAHTAGA